MGQTVSKSKFKAKALEYLRDVELRGAELVITDRGRPVAKVVPLSRYPDALLAPFRGTLLDYVEPTEPVASEDWEVTA